MKMYRARVFCVLVTLFLVTSCRSMNDWSFANWGYGQSAAPVTTGAAQDDPAVCTQQAAYRKGVADARAGKSIADKYDYPCPQLGNVLNIVYHQGYENGVAARLGKPVDAPQWVANGISGSGTGIIDGGSAVEETITPTSLLTSGSRNPTLIPGSGNKLKIKPYNPTEFRCFIDNYGTKVCGYYCDYANGVIKCADDKSKRCVKNDSGELVCGYNCVTTAKTVKCGQSAEEKCLSDAYGNVQCGINCQRIDGQVNCQPAVQ